MLIKKKCFQILVKYKYGEEIWNIFQFFFNCFGYLKLDIISLVESHFGEVARNAAGAISLIHVKKSTTSNHTKRLKPGEFSRLP